MNPGPTSTTARPTVDEARELLATDSAGALAICTTIGSDRDSSERDRADADYLAARILLDHGRALDALEKIQDARVHYSSAGDTLRALRTDLGHINVLDDLGRHVEALSVARRLQAEIRRARPEVDDSSADMVDWLEAAASENLGACHCRLGHHTQAVQTLHDAAVGYGKIGSPLDEARVIANLGVEHLELGEYAEATTALQTAESTLTDGGQLLLAQRSVVYLAQAQALAGSYGAALESLARAESLMSTESRLTATTDQLRNVLARAEVYAALNLWPEVLEHCEDLEPELNQRHLQRDLAQLELVRGRALFGSGDDQAAVDAARTAVTLLDRLHLSGRAAKARLVLARWLDVDSARHELELALSAFETAGETWGIAACAILSAEMAVTPPERDEWVDRAEEAGAETYPNLAWRLATLRGQRALDSGDVRGAEAELNRSLGTLRTLRDGVADQRRQIPFMQGRRSPLETLVDLQLGDGRLQAAFDTTAAERSWALATPLPDDRSNCTRASGPTVLYQSLGDRLIAFVTPDGENVSGCVDLRMTLPELDDCKRRLAAQWRRLADPRMRVHVDSLRSATEGVLQELYLGVFQPIDELLAATADETVTIVPTSRLAGVPFHALHDGMEYMIERRQVALAPFTGSSTLDKSNRPARTLVVGVADASAPDIAIEAEAVAEITGGLLLRDDDATVEAVRSAAADHDVVHFACHSVFRPENPQMSAIKLADGWLSATDVVDWPLTNAMVVMASCSSGQQGGAGEDELLGLPRSFLAAGASSVIMNLWPVDDVASVGLMTHFHNAVRNTSPAAALRSAQLAALDLHEHPYLWAPTVAYGAHNQSVRGGHP